MVLLDQYRILREQFHMGKLLGGTLSLWFMIQLHVAHITLLLGLFVSLRQHGDAGLYTNLALVAMWFLLACVLCLWKDDDVRARMQLILFAALYCVLWIASLVIWGMWYMMLSLSLCLCVCVCVCVCVCERACALQQTKQR
jgi:hypothetical protein